MKCYRYSRQRDLTGGGGTHNTDMIRFLPSDTCSWPATPSTTNKYFNPSRQEKIVYVVTDSVQIVVNLSRVELSVFSNSRNSVAGWLSALTGVTPSKLHGTIDQTTNIH